MHLITTIKRRSTQHCTPPVENIFSCRVLCPFALSVAPALKGDEDNRRQFIGKPAKFTGNRPSNGSPTLETIAFLPQVQLHAFSRHVSNSVDSLTSRIDSVHGKTLFSLHASPSPWTGRTMIARRKWIMRRLSSTRLTSAGTIWKLLRTVRLTESMWQRDFTRGDRCIIHGVSITNPFPGIMQRRPRRDQINGKLIAPGRKW